MKKTKLLLPLTAVTSLMAAIPALTLTSCNKKAPSTKPTQEEWTKAFEVLTKRGEGVCWHTTSDSYAAYGNGKTYEEADYGVKYTNIECGQKYNRMKCDYKYMFSGRPLYEAYTYTSTTNIGAPNVTVTQDKDNVVTGSDASTNIYFDDVFDWISVYASSYEDFKYNEETKIFEYSQANDITKAESKIKMNDSKQIEYIESVAQDGDGGVINMNLHFTYDKTEVVLSNTINTEITTKAQKTMTTSGLQINSEDTTKKEDGIDRGFILTIKPTATFKSLVATYPGSSTIHISVFDHLTTEIYKNGTKLVKDTDYTLSVGYATKITFIEQVKTTDTIVVAFNLTSGDYHGGPDELITLNLQ